MKDERIKLVYIAGYGRSGSTILDLYLGRHPDVLSVGEFSNFTEWVSENDPCCCGLPVRECALWGRVLREVPESAEGSVSYGRYAFAKKFRRSFRYILGFPLRADDREMAELNWRILRKALAISDKLLVLDSSKTFCRLYTLAASGLFDLKVIHLVRDGRGVGYSKTKKRKLTMLRYFEMQKPRPVSHTTRRWAINNLMVFPAYFRLPRGSYMLLRYEDFATRPKRVFERIQDFMGIKRTDLSACSGGPPCHNIGGNDLRIGRIGDIVPDEKWKTALGTLDRIGFVLNGGPLVHLAVCFFERLSGIGRCSGK